jgi:hypothetical protein
VSAVDVTGPVTATLFVSSSAVDATSTVFLPGHQILLGGRQQQLSPLRPQLPTPAA